MKIPFLHRISALGGPPVRQVVAAGTSPPAVRAAAALRHLLAELPELLLAAVLEVATGQPLATYAAERDWQPSLVAAPTAAAVRRLTLGLAAQPQADEQLREILLTLPSQLHLLRLRPGGGQLLYLAVDVRDTNLGIARQLAQQAMALLEEEPLS